MGLADWFDLYIERVSHGHTHEGKDDEVPDAAVGAKWTKSSRDNMEVAKRIWMNLLGNRPPRLIPREDIKGTFALVKHTPGLHGRSCN